MKLNISEVKNLKFVNFLGLTIAGIINSIGVTLFLMPVNLYDSGLSGLSMLVDKVTPEAWTISIFLLLFNFPFYLLGMKKQGICFTIYSMYAIAIYSLFAFLFSKVFPIDFSNASPIAGNDLLLCALFGGVLSGVGSGLTIRFGGALDGVEVLAVLFAKKINLSVGTFVMIFNILLYISAGLVFRSWKLPLYSIVTYAVGNKLVDFMVEGLDKAKGAFIVTTKSDEVAKAISNEFKLGITVLDAQGYYLKKKQTMLYCVINRFQVRQLITLIKKVDSNAFISIVEISENTNIGTKLHTKKIKYNNVITLKKKSNNKSSTKNNIE